MEGYDKVLPKEKELWLLRRIDELKHEVDCAEAETNKAEKEAQDHKEVIVKYHKLFAWVQENYPDIITTYRVINRLEGNDEYRVDNTR